jgi:hypothetical protein
MNSSQNDQLGVPRARPPRHSNRRAFARFGTPAILITVLLVVVAWMGFLGWVLIGLVSRFIG